MIRISVICLLLVAWLAPVIAQTFPVQGVLQEHAETIAKSSRKTIGPAIYALAGSGLVQAQDMLQVWQAKEMWQRKSDGLFFRGEEVKKRVIRLYDFDTVAVVGDFPTEELKQIKPDSGIRAMLAVALVQFQLSNPDPAKRLDALVSLERDPAANALTPLRGSIDGETDPVLLAKKRRLEQLLTIAYDANETARVAAIEEMSGDLGVDVRATLNSLVATDLQVFLGEVAGGWNIAGMLITGDTLPRADAYTLVVDAGLASSMIQSDAIRATLAENINGGTVGGVQIAQLSSVAARARAYAALVAGGLAEPAPTDAEIDAALAAHQFVQVYADASPAVTTAAKTALNKIATRVGVGQTVDFTLDALSLASIHFLAAIGLAITFGVMDVINMAHGEFIMMGAYTGFVVQQFVPNHTVSILVAIPLAFAVTVAAGVAMERLVIRWLYNRPLETLLAAFGISIALQRLAKNIFGTQARPLIAPGWLDAAWTS